MTREDALDAILADVRERLIAYGDHIRARGIAVYDRWEDDELPTDATEAILGSADDDLERLIDLIDRLDMLRARVGVRRAAERLG